MAIYGDFITLQKQVADECGDRKDLLEPLSDSALSDSPVKNAIWSAIAKWEREPFYFTEDYTVPLFFTVSGQELYGTDDDFRIATSPDLVKLHVYISGNRFPMDKRSWADLEDTSMNPAALGQPDNWAYFAKQIRLYPIPDGAYEIRASRIDRADALTDDGDTNVWTQDAYDLIRSEAKLIIAQEVLFDDDLAARMKLAIYGDPQDPRIKGYLGALRGESFRRARTRIRPSQF